MCCDGFHDAQAKLDVPGHVRFVTVCAVCGREQHEIARQPYTPDPRLGPVGGTGEPAGRAGVVPHPAIAA